MTQALNTTDPYLISFLRLAKDKSKTDYNARNYFGNVTATEAEISGTYHM